jgi:hypothetical protein
MIRQKYNETVLEYLKNLGKLEIGGPVRQFEGMVALDSKLDLKSDSWILN